MFIWLSKIVYMRTLLFQNFIMNLNNTSNSSTVAYTNFNSFKYASTLTYACFEEMCMSNNGLIYLNNLSPTLQFKTCPFNLFILRIRFSKLLSQIVESKTKTSKSSGLCSRLLLWITQSTEIIMTLVTAKNIATLKSNSMDLKLN